MIVFVNTFVVAGTAEEFERVFTETSDFLCGQPGFLSHRLVRSTSEPSRYVNVATWKDEAALRAATRQPGFADHARRLRALATSDPHFYEPVMERGF
ncbi:antibiotic biosynthesis monooxygenase family protein [Actinomadura gamaensis]|uniref:Antibiotic biosynthesis monooxygenase family protein n=1 Tax=Actinomadura gamaensis TaxID=1763541 RepID=A0ABV9U2Y1_9ACTN